MRNTLRPSAILLLVSLPFSAAQALEPDVEYHETIGDYMQVVYHQSIAIDDEHFFIRPTTIDSFWRERTLLYEDNEALENDYLALSHFAKHESGPHEEAANGTGAAGGTDIYADEWEEKWVRTRFDTLVVPHEEHFDLFDSELLTRMTHFIGIDQITGYIWMTGGMHTENPSISFSVHTVMTTTVRPEPDDFAYGGLMLQYDGQTNSMNVGLPVADLRPEEVLGAELYLGGLGEVGPMILSLGSGLDFTPVGADHAMLYRRDVPIAHEVMNEILAGNVYALVRTQQFPNGALRGQFAVVPEAGTLMLLAIGAPFMRLAKRSSVRRKSMRAR